MSGNFSGTYFAKGRRAGSCKKMKQSPDHKNTPNQSERCELEFILVNEPFFYASWKKDSHFEETKHSRHNEGGAQGS